MAQPPRNLFDAATARGRVIRQGDIACVIMDGAGAMVVPTQELMLAQKWAQSKPPSGNLLSDRARFLDKISALVSRPGSVQATRGNDKQLERLARAMQQQGYDLSEWTLPKELKNPRPLGAADPAPKPKAPQDAAEPAPETATSSDDQPA